MLAFHVSCVCQQPPPAVLLSFRFLPKKLQILAKSKVAVKLWALQVGREVVLGPRRLG